MFGKHFASTYTGSMFGAGTPVFAVWGYVIANTVDGQIELNPQLLAAVLGSSVEEMTQAIAYLCAVDPKSRSQSESGRRLVKEGAFAYRVVNHETYRQIRHEDDRRAYNRQKKAEERARKSKPVKTRVNDSQSMSAQAETEAETETEKKAAEKPPPKKGFPLAGYQRLRLFSWMLDDLMKILGDHAPTFDLDAWLQAIDTDPTRIIPKWPWLRDELEAECARRGLLQESFTPAELKFATDVRKVRMGCQHDPRCADFNACVHRIAREVRQKPSVAAGHRAG